MKLDVVELRVKNWFVSVTWYQEKLGLRIIAQEDDHQFALLVGEGGAKLGLIGTKQLPQGQSRATPYFITSQLEKVAAKLKQNGVDVGRIEKMHWGKQMKLTDPEGNVLYLYEEK